MYFRLHTLHQMMELAVNYVYKVDGWDVNQNVAQRTWDPLMYYLFWNEELPQHWQSRQNRCSNYQGTSLLSSAYKILSSIILPKLNPRVYEIIEKHCGCRLNRSTPDPIICIHLIHKKWACRWVYQLFTDFIKIFIQLEGRLYVISSLILASPWTCLY